MKTCKWQYGEEWDEGNVWETECRINAHYFSGDGTPTENEYKYCPYCGKLIEEIL